ncbi:hypothetical protein [Paraburkholderia sp. GAS348]|uniref:hypothetical protein n=1 Tax=Paraburkholderia sp. GAS348 TaxID=3035132 RepID=UPI003D1BA9BF
MNHSEDETQAVAEASQNAAQAIASSPTFDNPQTCATAPAAPTPAGKATAVRPKSEYAEFFSQHCRAGYGVAKVFSYLVLRNQRNKPGANPARLEVQRQGGRWGERAYWWLDTLQEIAGACGMTVKQVRTALEILDRLNQIEAHQGRHPINGVVGKYRNKSVLHIRLIVCERANGLDGWPTVEQMRTILECPKGHLITCPQGHPLVPDAEVGLDALEVKDSNTGFHSEDPTGAIPEIQQANSESQNPESPPDAVEVVPKFEKKKTGPKPKAVTSNGDWQHYNRLAMKHDMDALLQTCIGAGLVAGHRKMLDDDECSMIERIEHGLKTSPHDKTDTLESLILGARDWPGICAVFEYLEEKDLNAPAEPNFKFFTKHILVFLADPELLECYPKATPATATPSAEPAVCAGAVDTAEPVSEAVVCPQIPQVSVETPALTPYADDDDDEGYSHQEKLDAMRHMAMLEARQQAALAAAAAKTKATMFQGLKHAEAVAA